MWNWPRPFLNPLISLVRAGTCRAIRILVRRVRGELPDGFVEVFARYARHRDLVVAACCDEIVAKPTNPPLDHHLHSIHRVSAGAGLVQTRVPRRGLRASV